MKNYKIKKRISLIWILIAIITVLIILVGFFYWNTDDNSKLASLYGGLLTGFGIALIQLFLSWYEYKEIDRFKRMQVLDIRANRDDRQFYEDIIRNSHARIDIMGVTANRFINDFADLRSDREALRVLLLAMDRGVRVRILIPKKEFLLTNEQKQDADHVRARFSPIKSRYSEKFEVKFFDHAPAHSIFIFDDKCILGPVLPEISSKDTPAIQLMNTSPFAEKYLNYFEKEWLEAQN